MGFKRKAIPLHAGGGIGRDFRHTPETRANFEKQLDELHRKVAARFLRPGGFTGKVPKTSMIEEVKRFLNGHAGRHIEVDDKKYRALGKHVAERRGAIHKELIAQSEHYYIKGTLDDDAFTSARRQLMAEDAALGEYLKAIDSFEGVKQGDPRNLLLQSNGLRCLGSFRDALHSAISEIGIGNSRVVLNASKQAICI